MTLPREMKLVRTSRGLEVHSQPVRELAALRRASLPIASGRIKGQTELVGSAFGKGGLLEFNVNLKLNDAHVVELTFKNGGKEATVFRINRGERRYELDRSASGVVDFGHPFARLQTAPMPEGNDLVSVHAFLDHSSVEIFVNDGETIFTDLIFPHSPYDSLEVSADHEVEILPGIAYALQSIWPRP